MDTEPSEQVEEMCIHQNLQTGNRSIYILKLMLGSMLKRIPLKQQYQIVVKLGSYIHETITNF